MIFEVFRTLLNGLKPSVRTTSLASIHEKVLIYHPVPNLIIQLELEYYAKTTLEIYFNNFGAQDHFD